MHRDSGITVFRCNTTRLARLVQTSAVNVRDYAFVGDNPIGMAHTSYGRFTYVNDAHGDAVYKIDNASNTVVEDRSAPRRRYASRGGEDGPSWYIGFAKNLIPVRRLRRACVIASAS